LSDDKLKIAVFIDFDNIEIGVKTTLGQHLDVGAVLEALKERGEIVTKFAYGDWTRAGEYGRAMSQHAIHMVQRNLTPGGDKNGADINLALDALEMAFTHSHINTFVIVGGDSDFISLVEKLKQYDRKVFVVGGRAFTSVVMQKNCTEFLAYENLVGRGRQSPKGGRATGDLAQAMPLVRRALKLLADREVLPQLGLLKSTLLQLDSAFSERDFGASTFRDFVQKLANAGYVTLKGTDRSFHVELREGADAPAPVAAVTAAPAAAAPPARTPRARASGGATPAAVSAPEAQTDVPRVPPADTPRLPPADAPRVPPADLARLFQQAFAAQKAAPRWPLYVRQIKQAVKAIEPQFDERTYGFSGIIEALRFGQREGLFRIERDRLGVVRVFPGPALQRAETDLPSAPVAEDAEPATGAADAGASLDTVIAAAPPVADIEGASPGTTRTDGDDDARVTPVEDEEAADGAAPSDPGAAAAGAVRRGRKTGASGARARKPASRGSRTRAPGATGARKRTKAADSAK
jgi:uncharacterized LabA/DUF88 family protein